MKKIFSSITMIAIVFGFTACGNSQTSSEKQVEDAMNDTMTVELVDTATIDTVNAGTRGGTESEGFGRCLESGCYCKEFKGRGQTCRNCGHAYKRHY